MKNQWEVDKQNDRIVAYLPQVEKGELDRIIDVFQKESLGKLIIYSLATNSALLMVRGFHLEGKMSGFFYGEQAFIFTKYGNENRSVSTTTEDNNSVLTVVQKDNKDLSDLQVKGFTLELARNEDMEHLAELYKIVFPVYPTDIYDPAYLRKVKEENYTFIVAKNESGKIVGAASAMDTGYGSAEITDCAVHPDYRGKQILHGIILSLESELGKQGIYYPFSITRAKSIGMNMTVKRLGYTYEGTLTNNCIISTGFEDMNVWTKRLRGN